MSKPKILFIDLETLPNKVLNFSLWQDSTPYVAVEKERTIICGCYKWLGQKKVHTISISQYTSFDDDVYDDYMVCQDLMKVILEADVVVYHNGKKFDRRFWNTRLLINGMDPMPKLIDVDTLKVARKHFYFNSNRLNDICETLGLGNKLATGGMSLWKRIACPTSYDDQLKATYKMEEYCAQDIVLLEKLYVFLRPWMDNHPNLNLITGDADACPSCGKKHTLKTNPSWAYGSTLRYQRYRCEKSKGGCGAWSKARVSDKSVKTNFTGNA